MVDVMKYIVIFLSMNLFFKCNSMDMSFPKIRDGVIGMVTIVPTVVYGKYLSARVKECLNVAAASENVQMLRDVESDLDIVLPLIKSSFQSVFISLFLFDFKFSTASCKILETFLEWNKMIRRNENRLRIQGISFRDWLCSMCYSTENTMNDEYPLLP